MLVLVGKGSWRFGVFIGTRVSPFPNCGGFFNSLGCFFCRKKSDPRGEQTKQPPRRCFQFEPERKTGGGIKLCFIFLPLLPGEMIQFERLVETLNYRNRNRMVFFGCKKRGLVFQASCFFFEVSSQ